jgi:hypothetical protein
LLSACSRYFLCERKCIMHKSNQTNQTSKSFVFNAKFGDSIARMTQIVGTDLPVCGNWFGLFALLDVEMCQATENKRLAVDSVKFSIACACACCPRSPGARAEGTWVAPYRRCPYVGSCLTLSVCSEISVQTEIYGHTFLAYD